MDSTWSITELAERAVAALAAGDAVQVNGRVRDLPNERLIRWYTTIGLVDPPLGRRGRTALYGPRHLLQLVAVKRRQSAGHTIAEIQLELTGATNATLQQIAGLSEPPPPAPHFPVIDVPVEPAQPPPTTARRARAPRPEPAEPEADSRTPTPTGGTGDSDISAAATCPPKSSTPVGSDTPTNTSGSDNSSAATSPTEPGIPASSSAPTDTGDSDSSTAAANPTGSGTPTDTGGTGDSDSSRAATGPTESGGRAGLGSSVDAANTGISMDADDTAFEEAEQGFGAATDERAGERSRFWAARPDISYRASATLAPPVVQGVRLAHDLTVLLNVPALSADDLIAIQEAARPLLAELHRRGLITAAPPAAPRDSPSNTPADHHGRPQ